MTFSMKRFQAIVQKEWKDSIRNPQVLTMTAFPIVFAFLFARMGTDRTVSEDILMVSFPILMALSMTGSFVLAMMIAEEKEKHTLRALMLSPASTLEILLGKSFLTAVLTVVAILFSIMASAIPGVPAGILALFILINLIMFIAIGLMIGLLSRTVQESSIIGLPVLLVFVMAPMFAPMLNNELLIQVVSILPTQKFMDMMNSMAMGQGWQEIGGGLMISILWMIASIVAAVAIYSPRRFDN
ncbi:ABC transporter permease [Paenibacillus gallinarum]|uniref:ABC transporter permease n=1 Tax=Paenibacillus gallinarum TaxID=2762232 RepID=A0ABR8T503_9BACL|nr:ABC transporter permease [Paenibacillus gallinarum]MBD7970840.1 ABC transporter permease [Paenibacillus gallinarum]